MAGPSFCFLVVASAAAQPVGAFGAPAGAGDPAGALAQDSRASWSWWSRSEIHSSSLILLQGRLGLACKQRVG